MRKNNENRGPAGILFPAAVMGLVMTLLLLLLGAVLVRRGTVAETMVRPCALVGLAAGCAAAAFLAAKRASGGKLLWAVGGGMLVFLLLLALGVLLARQPIHILRTVVSLVCAVAASAAGGAAGATARKIKRYSHIKK